MSSENLMFSLVEHEKVLSYDLVSGSEIMSCNKINKPLVVYRFSGNVTLRT